jgi:hypothetical protein
MNPKDQEQVAAMAARAMGETPQAQQMPQQQSAPQKQTDTAAEQAAAKGAPDTEGDQMQKDAIFYDIPFGDDGADVKRMTPQQIAGMATRYRDLNHKNAQYKPVMSLVEKLMAANPNATPAQIAERLDSIIRASTSNPQMGNIHNERSGTTQQPSPHEGQRQPMSDRDFEAWERENASTLPPGYRDMLMGNQQNAMAMQQLMAQNQQMMQMLAQTQGVADAARNMTSDANRRVSETSRQRVGNNIVQAFQGNGLPLTADEARVFSEFYTERGYTDFDLEDPGLVTNLVRDYSANRSIPELERLREMSKRRSAYTGSLGATPSQGGASQAKPAPGNEALNRLIDANMR